MGLGLLWIWGSDWLVASLTAGDAATALAFGSVKGTAFVVGTGALLYFVLQSTRRRQEQRTQAAQRLAETAIVSQRLEALGMMAGTLAHDFNNVVTIIRAAGEMAKLDNFDPHTTPGHFETIDRAVAQAHGMVRNMMRFMRSEPEAQTVGAVDDLLRDAMPVLRQAVGRSMPIELRCTAGLPPVKFEAAQLQRALLNLVVNAREASVSAAEKRIEIQVGARRLNDYVSLFRGEPASGEFVTVSVTDAGCGIARDDLKRIFTPFYSTKKSSGGNGLGLTSVQLVLEGHGGWVEVASERGAGACFTLFLPAALPAESAMPFVREAQLVHA